MHVYKSDINYQDRAANVCKMSWFPSIITRYQLYLGPITSQSAN